jgi:hypothetical protein
LSTVPYKQNGPDQWGLVKTCFLRLKTPKIHEKKRETMRQDKLRIMHFSNHFSISIIQFYSIFFDKIL